MYFITIFVIIFYSLGDVNSLECYQCGIVMSNGDTCDVKSPYASIIKVTCPAGDFCSMTTSRGWTSEGVVETTTRGCAAPKTMIGKVHDLGCHVDQRTGAVVCYCNSNFCNGFSYSYSVSCQRVSLLLVIAIPLIILYIQ